MSMRDIFVLLSISLLTPWLGGCSGEATERPEFDGDWGIEDGDAVPDRDEPIDGDGDLDPFQPDVDDEGEAIEDSDINGEADDPPTDGDDLSEGDLATDADLPSDGDTLTEADGPIEGEAADDDDSMDTGLDGEASEVWIVPPSVSCEPQGDVCQLGPSTSGIWANYRKDYYFPDSLYPEYTDPPTSGGRFQIAAVSSISGEVREVYLNDQKVTDLVGSDPQIEWWHVWPYHVTEGEPVWFAFHSRKAAWDNAQTGSLRIETDQGDAVNGLFQVAQSALKFTYVTTTDDRTVLVLHLKNTDTSAHTVRRVLVNGRDVMSSDVLCLPKTRVEAGESVMWTLRLCEPIPLGSAWTVVAEWQDAPPSVGVGRALREHFVIEAWAASSDCPFPGVNDETYQAHREIGVDVTHTGWGICEADTAQVLGVTLPSLGDYFALLASDYLVEHPVLASTAGLAGFLTGDESDGEIYDDVGKPNAENKARAARAMWKAYPELPTYNGSKTNGNVGTFTGITDIHGMDVYIGACAPHITQWGGGTPIRMPYDYFVNVRANHMPLPNWFYAQGLGSMWNGNQPNRQEVILQGWEVAAAGGKGLMWFQTRQSLAEQHPEVMQAMGEVNWMYWGIRQWLREGDPTGMASGGPDVIVESIRSRRALIVPVINLKFVSGPNDITCLAAGIGLAPHWIWAANNPRVEVDIPPDFGVNDVFEIGFRQILDTVYGYQVNGRKVVFPSVPLNNDTPVRVLVLTSDPELREAILEAMME